MALQRHGRSGYAERITRHNRLARHLGDLIDQHPDLERVAPITLSIVCFRFRSPAAPSDGTALDDLNKRIMETVQTEGEVFISQAVLNGRFALRACIIHPDTSEADVQALVDIVSRTGHRRLAPTSS